VRQGRLIQDAVQQRVPVLSDAVYLDLDGERAGFQQQLFQLCRGFLHMRTDDHRTRAFANPVVSHIGVHRGGGHRLRRQFRQGGQQAGGGAEQEALALRRRRLQLRGEMVEVGLGFGVDHATTIALQGHQPIRDIAAHVIQQEAFDLARLDPAGGLFFHVVG